mmetsp:Transcript_39501/g.77731  ORF Transcript_39501/g.77731 Transcript_39501/m.77731 type:complete len:150 (-) Transcript_39501:2234-2683(-)
MQPETNKDGRKNHRIPSQSDTQRQTDESTCEPRIDTLLSVSLSRLVVGCCMTAWMEAGEPDRPTWCIARRETSCFAPSHRETESKKESHLICSVDFFVAFHHNRSLLSIDRASPCMAPFPSENCHSTIQGFAFDMLIQTQKQTHSLTHS